MAIAVSCGGSGGQQRQVPVALLSASPKAQRELHDLLQRFSNASSRERIALKSDFASLRRRYMADDIVHVIDVHLAWIALEKGDLSYADALATRIRSLGAGTTGDLAQVIQGAVLRRSRRPKQAFDKLRPLVGKLIDGYARALLNEEVLAAAIESRAWSRAVDMMSVWLGEVTDEERPGLRAQIAAFLPNIPAEQLAPLLRQRRRNASDDIPSSELDLQTLLAERVAAAALERKDVPLAKDLLAHSGSLLGAWGDPIAQLAAGASVARVEAPTVGLLLSLRTSSARRRGADVAAGVSFGLGLPGSAARLVSRDDGGQLERVDAALTSLSAEGAAVLIAGVDSEQASRAATFARLHEVPMLLLSPPDSALDPSPFVFVMGQDFAAVTDLLLFALAERRVKKVAVLTDDAKASAPGDDPAVVLKLSCEGALDATALRAASLQGLVLNGDAFCADRALTAIESPKLMVAFGLDAASSATDGALVATVGRFPFLGDQQVLETWLATHPAVPGFWTALGRDAGVLAWEAVRNLPQKATEDPAQVKARRRAVATALSRVSGDLWTTEAKGFAGASVLSRKMGVQEIKSAPKR